MRLPSRASNCHRFSNTETTYIPTSQTTIHFLNFFHYYYRPILILTSATSTNSTLLNPIHTLVFPSNISPRLARGAGFTILIGIFPLLPTTVLRPLSVNFPLRMAIQIHSRLTRNKKVTTEQMRFVCFQLTTDVTLFNSGR